MGRKVRWYVRDTSSLPFPPGVFMNIPSFCWRWYWCTLKMTFPSFTCGWRYLHDEASVNEIRLEVPGMRSSGLLCQGTDLAEDFFLLFAFPLTAVGLKSWSKRARDDAVETRSLDFSSSMLARQQQNNLPICLSHCCSVSSFYQLGVISDGQQKTCCPDLCDLGFVHFSDCADQHCYLF